MDWLWGTSFSKVDVKIAGAVFFLDGSNTIINLFIFQMDGSEWSWDNCNSLCWAVGSISGTLNEMKEKFFLIGVIRVIRL